MVRRAILLSLIIALLLPAVCLALPDTLAVIVTDVTPSSACLVWLTDTPAEPSVEVYSDQSMSNNITSQFKIVTMPGASTETASTAKSKGVMKVRVQGLEPQTTYYLRAITVDAANPESKSFSALQELKTRKEVSNYTWANDEPVVFSNDLASFPVYIIPGTAEQKPGLGDIIVLETPNAQGAVSSFVGEGILSPESVIDLNNLFGQGGVSVILENGEKSVLTVYRGGVLPSLVHYRWLQDNSGMAEVKEPVKGFFADFNLDGVIDMADFEQLRKYYRTKNTDEAYNPDYDYVTDAEGSVDAREFSMFSEQYGRRIIFLNLTVDKPSPQIRNTSMTFTVTATGSSGESGGSFEYEFLLYDGQAWSEGKAYSGVNTWTWDTTSFVPGSYKVRANVRNLGGVAAFDSFASMDYTIEENTVPPMITVPPDITEEATGPITTVYLGEATAEGISEPITITNDAPVSGFNVGITAVTWTATDAYGLTSSEVQEVSIVDTTPPSVTAPADITVEATGQTATVDINTAVATDAVGVVSIYNDAPALFPVGATVVTWTATDAAGNTGSDIQLVTVLEAFTPANVSAIAARGTAGVTQPVECVWSDPNGASDLDVMYLQVGSETSYTILMYDGTNNVLKLLDDSQSLWLGGYAPGSANTISNSLITIKCANTSVTTSGNNTTVDFSVNPTDALDGTQQLSLYVTDKEGNHAAGYELAGNWTIVAPLQHYYDQENLSYDTPNVYYDH